MNPSTKGWRGYLFWEGFPFLMLFGLFGLISITNWGYESKLFHLLRDGSTWMAIYAGPLMLACAIGMAFTASILVLPSMFIIILGPAMISIMESMAQVPGH